MGSRGPLKKTKLTVVKGAPDKRARDAFHPECPPAYRPQEPDWHRILGPQSKRLVADAHAEWELTVTELERRGMIARTDASTVVDYCLCHARVLQCERRLSREGFVIAGDRGPVKNPVAQLLGQWRSSLQKHRDSLGLSPLAMRRLDREEEAPPDDESDLDEAPEV
jgi:P27 family predicted phage terminase small subunit